jgi:hypothetical protein
MNERVLKAKNKWENLRKIEFFVGIESDGCPKIAPLPENFQLQNPIDCKFFN